MWSLRFQGGYGSCGVSLYLRDATIARGHPEGPVDARDSQVQGAVQQLVMERIPIHDLQDCVIEPHWIALFVFDVDTLQVNSRE